MLSLLPAPRTVCAGTLGRAGVMKRRTSRSKRGVKGTCAVPGFVHISVKLEAMCVWRLQQGLGQLRYARIHRGAGRGRGGLRGPRHDLCERTKESVPLHLECWSRTRAVAVSWLHRLQNATAGDGNCSRMVRLRTLAPSAGVATAVGTPSITFTWKPPQDNIYFGWNGSLDRA